MLGNIMQALIQMYHELPFKVEKKTEIPTNKTLICAKDRLDCSNTLQLRCTKFVTLCTLIS